MANTNQDMFDKLKDSLLLVIVSLLPFQEAARTSILAKRWRDLWRQNPNMEFNESFFVNSSDNEQTKENQRTVFIDFVKQYIANYKDLADVQKFTLNFSRPQNFLEDIHQFVTFSLARNVKKLSLDFSDPTWKEDDEQHHEAYYTLPHHFYGHTLIESLKLFSCSFEISGLRNFRALKELSLGWIELQASTIKTFLDSCPLLESLMLKKCHNIGPLLISGQNLKIQTLVLDKNEVDDDIYYFETPNLRTLKYCGIAGHFAFEGLHSLQEADLDFGPESEFEEIGYLLQEFMRELYAVQTLRVCSYVLQVLPTGEEPYRTTSALDVRHLILRAEVHPHEFCGIKFLLGSCPSLEKLTIEISPARNLSEYKAPYAFNPSTFWTRNLIVHRCLQRTLNTVEIRGFKGTHDELLFLNYLLKFGGSLTQLNLYLSREVGDANGGNQEIYVERAQMVQHFKRKSVNLSVSIY